MQRDRKQFDLRPVVRMLLAGSCLVAGPVLAQDTAAGAGRDAAASDSDIIVTAQRREESLLRVPVSITVLGGEALDSSTASGVTEALRAVPGVSTLLSYQGGGTLVTIRGISAGQALFNGAGTVGYYIDAVPFGGVKSAIAPDTSAFDLERVEVLRGPQGTLYGASALNGVVRILTAPADASGFAMKARVSGATTKGGDGSFRADVAANVPVIEDKLAVRATAGYQREGGWIDTGFGDNVNAGDIWNMRLRVNATPTERLSVELSGWISRSDFGGPATGETQDSSSTAFPQPIENGFDFAGAKVAYEFDAFTVNSATSYLTYRSQSIIDFTPFAGFNSQLTTDLGIEVFTQEVSLNSNGDGPWRWSVGGIYREGTERLAQTIPEFGVDIGNFNRSVSWAGFGEITRVFADGRFELTGGLRVFEDRISQESRATAGGPVVSVPDAKANATTPRVVATWFPSETATVYASYSQGFRSGAPQATAATSVPPARPDRLHNYELGTRGTLFDGLMAFDAAAFYIYWQDVQQNITVIENGIPFSATINGEAASGFGADASVTLRPAPGLNISGSFGWNDITLNGDVFSGGVLLFAKGSRLNFSPEYTATIAGDYAHDIGGDLTARFSASGTFTSGQVTRVLLGSAVSEGRTGDVFIPRASIALESRAGWTATLYGDNLTNFSSPIAPGFGAFEQYLSQARPRTFGVQFEYRY